MIESSRGGMKRGRNWKKLSKRGMKEEKGSEENGIKGEWKRKKEVKEMK